MTHSVIGTSGMDLRLHSKQFISKFIEEFRKNSCLWNILHPEYKNKKSRMKAYNRLLKFSKAAEPNITIDEIKKKIQSMRASHRKERRKVAGSLLKATSPKEFYVPKLWYYKELEFLNTQMEETFETTNVDEDDRLSEKFKNDNISENSINFDEIEVKIQPSDDDDNESVKSITSNLSLTTANPLHETWGSPSTSTSKKPMETNQPLEQNIRNNNPNETFNYIARKLDHNIDEFDIFGQSVAAELRKMNSRQQIIAKKLMNDVIFHGQLQHLTVDAQIQINNFYTES
ncbi:uncharacterized protein LOC123873022 [Maniola jurtina]|uniref:uncharacterized protein LOC123873022 n=1 Tax=Maniola jurtina TaxID=191418 RepID=UPI001E689247|nr:uncharacterized protein LOC123873022 [Maniola jurtina]